MILVLFGKHLIDQLQLTLSRLERKVNTIMATQAEVVQLLADANTATNDIAADIERLLTREEVSDEVRDELTGLVTRLQGVAAQVPEPE